MKNKCPHPSCENEKPREMYACKPHWFSLPIPIRRKIGAGFTGRSGSNWLAAHNLALEFWGKK